ncbi:SAC3/GANP/Nin1/mts3/eIF-3 p25 family [Rhynchospora pubera]|uniref:SAC3/GANP/Nin1/mts3/eIF-3 p25 family n=1 Tax=Rhynchospora pubera TaxID=906938 RepID=A0AAV8CQH9_9POAL|nr:SAC3/GANP/Nin1/mts3/eIF-3 p25 family [Rhynchospora pubera]
MEGGFGKSAGPRGPPRAPGPSFGPPAAPSYRPGNQFPARNFGQSAPRQSLSPPTQRGIHSRLTYVRPNSTQVPTDAAHGFGDVARPEPSKQARSPTTQIVPRPVSPSTTQTPYSNFPPRRNRSPVSQHASGSQPAFQTPSGEFSKRTRSPISENLRSEKPPNEMYYQTGLRKSRSPALEPGFVPRSEFQINSGRRPVAYTDSIFDGNNDEPPKRSQNLPVENLRNRLSGPNQNLGSQSAFLAPKRSVFNSNFLPDGPGESLKQVRSPVPEIARFGKPSDTEMHYQDGFKESVSHSPNPDFIPRTSFQINTGRKPVAYTDSIFDHSGVEPSRGNQSSKGNQFPPAVQSFRRNVAPQKSHKNYLGPQDSGNLRALPSAIHDVVDSAPPESFAQREEEAKARRLARFGVELSQPVVEAVEPVVIHTEPSKQQADIEFSEATAIVGLCPDMCPEPERSERERKGDLDKHERLDGDRNQTTKFLAVKKYNRTAERDPDLIRPLPILMKTMDYLLELLDRPYGDDFLGLYNFLWDRMRAVRMDLRMQHIFNLEAISMLEQMIRLHIVAMHEFCEYNKGEGFSEGFDAHLNIEQMNKASVELFQMYEDHRRKGISIPTEKEFRGYYALLKLDKHPGYKVEPAELSLDLAKMSSEVRHSPEIAFAREVAKSCRVGNYISFFRLAKKATFLQACLMHAHFSKLRIEALASLHSSFPINQGMPLSQLENMLAMEGEDIENFVEHHGLVLKSFEEMYIVKDGPFLREEGDPPSKRSPLVDTKKSDKIKLDVCFKPVSKAASKEEIFYSPRVAGIKRVSPGRSETDLSDSPRPLKVSNRTQLELQPVREYQEMEHLPATIPERPIDAIPLPLTSPPVSASPVHVVEAFNAHRAEPSTLSSPVSLASSSTNVVHVTSGFIASSDNQMDASIKEGEAEIVEVEKCEKELFKETLKPIFRKWRQRTMELRLHREKKEKKEALVREALGSISLGPLMRTSVDKAPRKDIEFLNIDRAIQARLRKQEKSWSVMNISELVTPILAEQNPDARCLCWKLLLSLPAGPADTLPTKWLLNKFNLKEAGKEDSIFKMWSGAQLSLSFVRADKTDAFEKDSVSGASCILFLVSGDTPLEVQKVRLHNLFQHIPVRSKLPLLIAISDCLHEEEESAITAKLGLPDIEQTKLSGISVIYLNQDLQNGLPSNGLFDDGRLREGVRWLSEHSPLQSEVSLVDARTILLSYLKAKLGVVNDTYDERGPDHCISAINGSIDWLIDAVLDSASANPNFWPCPEINLLDKSSSERNYAEMTLPKASWSEPQKIQAQIDAYDGIKFPGFGFDLSWLNQGSNCTDKKQVQDQKRALEECLFSYLNMLAGFHEAWDEARDLVQRCTNLVLRDLCYYLVPRWTAIFRRIFNLRLMTIVNKASDVYISEDIANMHYFNVQWTDLLVSNELPHLSLDERIESCFLITAATVMPTIPTMPDVYAEVLEETRADEEYGVVQKVYEVPDNVGPPVKEKKQSKFALLLDQCTKIQDEIDEKLYFYF